MNEAATVGTLRTIGHQQLEYAVKHPREGFACRLSHIEMAEESSGYRFHILCQHDGAGRAIHYQVLASPLQYGNRWSGCVYGISDSSADFWSDNQGSEHSCPDRR
jgi:hypothetical protein